MKGAKQTTLRHPVAVSGIGVHSGLPVTLTLHPADDDAGIVFQRIAADGSIEREIRADVRAVTATEFATVLGDAKGPLCSTAEHLLAALRGLYVDNVVVEIDGPEVPIMDGSAGPFVFLLQSAGIEEQRRPKRFIRVKKRLRVEEGGKWAQFDPFDGFKVNFEIEFNHPIFKRRSQKASMDFSTTSFLKEVSRARTFGFMRDVAKLWSAGYALGASFENTVVVAEDRILNPEGVRYADEFVRHKVVDAIGDLALSGAPLIGVYRTVRGGHKLNHVVLSALMSDRSAWRVVEAAEPVRRARGSASLVTGLVAPAYGPEVS
jgi:UDP-3-O-[3-hydroxymyristoyl] N-acetylglucosamine deacetylase